jgi:hypothetical protein
VQNVLEISAASAFPAFYSAIIQISSNVASGILDF